MIAFHVWLAWWAGGAADSAGASPAAWPNLDASSATSSAASDVGSASTASSLSGSPSKKRPRSRGGSRARPPPPPRGPRGRPPPPPAPPAAGGAALRRRRLRAARWGSVGRYLLPRLVVLAFFAAWLVALPTSGAYALHLHHYALGFAIAIFAAFNHPVSGLVLALATAVFVQVRGILTRRGWPEQAERAGRDQRRRPCTTHCCTLSATVHDLWHPPHATADALAALHTHPCPLLQGGAAYGFDPMFEATGVNGTGCISVSSPPTGQVGVAWVPVGQPATLDAAPHAAYNTSFPPSSLRAPLPPTLAPPHPAADDVCLLVRPAL